MASASAVDESVAIIRREWAETPRAAVVLGTGLGGLVEHIDVAATFAYRDLRGFPTPTAIAHVGKFVCGTLAGVPVLAMQGRVHYYEGFDFDQITLPVRVAAALGSELLIVSNASGGINPRYSSGDIMVLDDHIDLMAGRNRSQLNVLKEEPSTFSNYRAGTRPSYDAELAAIATEVGRRDDFGCHCGVYVAVTGPNYETRAEYRFMRKMGGDVVGMSTVPEVIAAREAGMRVLALSAVTNVAKPDAPDTVDAMEVVDIAEHAEPRLRAIVTEVLTRLKP